MAKFTKGQSGNPKGRPTETIELKTAKAMARALVAKAMGRLEYWSDSSEPKASVAASVAILNRAEGMPKQEVENTGKGMIVPVVNVTIGGTKPLPT